MKTILCSKSGYVKQEMQQYIKNAKKIVILPWAFANELNENDFENEYFPVNGRRYSRYIDLFSEIQIEEFWVGNCYKHNPDEIVKKIVESDIVILPGGNPEMMYNKLMANKKVVNALIEYKGLLIGESAGACMQFKKYLLTKENNYYGYQAFYDGIGRLDVDFLMDVHTIDTKEYLENLKKIGKKVYAIFDEGMMFIEDDKINLHGKVKIIK